MSAFGPDFLVNFNNGSGDQAAPSVTALNDGRFVIVWQTADPTTDGSGTAIVMQIYNPDGSPSGEAQIVNTESGGDQILPVVAALDNGGFAIAWQSDATDGSGMSIRARVYDDAGQPLADEFIANSLTNGHQYNPSIVGLEGGGFAVAWTSDDFNESGTALRARYFDNNGSALFNSYNSNFFDFHLNANNANGDQVAVSLAATANGGIFAVWESADGVSDTDGTGIRAIRSTMTARRS